MLQCCEAAPDLGFGLLLMESGHGRGNFSPSERVFKPIVLDRYARQVPAKVLTFVSNDVPFGEVMINSDTGERCG